jgi:hypothetical protein
MTMALSPLNFSFKGKPHTFGSSIGQTLLSTRFGEPGPSRSRQVIRLGGGSLVRYPGVPQPPSRRGDRRRDSNKPQPTDRRSGLFGASDWRISWVDEEKRLPSRRGLPVIAAHRRSGGRVRIAPARRTPRAVILFVRLVGTAARQSP